MRDILWISVSAFTAYCVTCLTYLFVEVCVFYTLHRIPFYTVQTRLYIRYIYFCWHPSRYYILNQMRFFLFYFFYYYFFFILFWFNFIYFYFYFYSRVPENDWFEVAMIDACFPSHIILYKSCKVQEQVQQSKYFSGRAAFLLTFILENDEENLIWS